MKTISRVNASYGLLFFVMAGLTLATFFFRQIHSNFGLIFGDEIDAVIEGVLVSHWYGWLAGLRSWRDPLYFFPHGGVLGYNDGYFLYGLLSAPFRFMGFNLLVSQELVHFLVKMIGFVGMAALLNRLCRRRSIVSLLGAAFFTLAISSSNQAFHGQLLSVALSPLLAVLLIKTWDGIQGGNLGGALLFGVTFVLSYVAVLMTSFYMAWFFGFFVIIFSASYSVLLRGEARQIVCRLFAAKQVVLFLVVLAAISLVPFLDLYLPKLKETGGQDYRTQLLYGLYPIDLLNYGEGSLIWGGLYGFVQSKYPELLRAGEYQVGFTPDVIALLAVILIFSFSARRLAFPRWYWVLVFATILALLLPVSVSGHSLWFVVGKLIPGASGMRVIARFYIYLAFPVAVIISLFFAGIIENKRVGSVAGVLLMLFVVIGQINVQPPVVLSVRSQKDLVDSVPRPPEGCRSFFVTNPILSPGNQKTAYLSSNVQAMLIADEVGIPTLNGIATFVPHDLSFAHKTNFNLLGFRAFIRDHALDDVCMLDLQNRSWREFSEINFFGNLPPYHYGDEIRFHSTGADDGFLISGWSNREPWGVWSDGLSSSLVLPLDSTGRDGLSVGVSVIVHAFLAQEHPNLAVDVSANGHHLDTWIFQYPQGAQDHVRAIVVPKAVVAANPYAVELRFTYKDPISPHALNVSGDRRALGLGLVAMKASPLK